MHDMTVVVRSDVATCRPPRAHASMFTTVGVDYRDGSEETQYRLALLDAREVAYHMAMCHPHVVMVVKQEVIDILAI